MPNEIPWTTPNAVAFPITVYYDHSCVLCRSEIEHIKVRDERGMLLLVDCSAADFDDSKLPVSKATLMDCIHAIDLQGRWVKASDVFVVLYTAVGMHRTAKAWSFGKPIAEKLYPLIVRHRTFLSKLGIDTFFNWQTRRYLAKKAAAAHKNSQACRDDACAVTTQ